MIRIGYPCINLSLKCRPGRTFRISSFNEKIFLEKAENNLRCLSEIIDFNIKNEIYFFRISSDIIPFASHPINKIKWEIIFKDLFREIGEKIKKNKIRVSMHPDQFVILNSPDKDVVKRSVDELIYHLKFLENLNTSFDAKIQIHIGGGYKDKKSSIERFLKNYEKLPLSLKERLVVENDERIYNLKDCLNLHEKAGIPIVADYLHHRLNNNGERFSEILKDVIKTWKIKDGPPIVDYSSLKLSGRKGSHAEKIDLKDFYSFLKEVLKVTSCIDIMLEIKDKEKSALKAINFIKNKNIQLPNLHPRGGNKILKSNIKTN